MTISTLNPEFAGLGVVPAIQPQILSLYAVMPIGKFKGEHIDYLLIHETAYMRWFADSMDRYVLSPEARCELEQWEKYHDPRNKQSYQIEDEADIPW